LACFYRIISIGEHIKNLVRAVLIGTFLSAVAATMPAKARAWGEEGHKIIALIAYHHLAPSVRAGVDRMLSADPDHLTGPDIASAATWADKYRDSDRNSTKKRYQLTRQWHFVDIEIDSPDLSAACFGWPAASMPASLGPAKACVVDRIDAFRDELQSLPETDPEKVLALKFLLHLVGDVHQPLHAADHGDQGGNGVKVLFGHRKVGMALHGFWDTEIVKRNGADPAIVAGTLDQVYGARCDGWMSGTPSDWALESFGIAKEFVYKLGYDTVDSKGDSAFRLSNAYQIRAVEIAGEQLEKAGCRLAMVLTQSLQ
jgi:S1/P1 Nuclease